MILLDAYSTADVVTDSFLRHGQCLHRHPKEKKRSSATHHHPTAAAAAIVRTQNAWRWRCCWVVDGACPGDGQKEDTLLTKSVFTNSYVLIFNFKNKF